MYSGLSDVTWRLNNNDISGYYKVDRVINNNYDSQNTEMLLKTDGTFYIRNISSSVFTYSRRFEKKITLTGNWELVSLHENKYYLSMDQYFDPEHEIMNRGASYKIMIKDKIPVIVLKYGDPDECSAIRFIKKNK